MFLNEEALILVLIIKKEKYMKTGVRYQGIFTIFYSVFGTVVTMEVSDSDRLGPVNKLYLF